MENSEEDGLRSMWQLMLNQKDCSLLKLQKKIPQIVRYKMRQGFRSSISRAYYAAFCMSSTSQDALIRAERVIFYLKK